MVALIRTKELVSDQTSNDLQCGAISFLHEQLALIVSRGRESSRSLNLHRSQQAIARSSMAPAR